MPSEYYNSPEQTFWEAPATIASLTAHRDAIQERIDALQAELQSVTPTPEFHPGQRLRTKIADCDRDENDRERSIPVGTAGTIRDIAHREGNTTMFDIDWDNGAWTIWSDEEIRRDAELLGPAAHHIPLAAGELADCLRRTRPDGEPIHPQLRQVPREYKLAQWSCMVNALADFCASQNPRFNRERWLAYISRIDAAQPEQRSATSNPSEKEPTQ